MAPKIRVAYSLMEFMHHLGDNIYTGACFVAGTVGFVWYYNHLSIKENYDWYNRFKTSYTVVRDTDVEDPNARHLN